MSNLIPLHEPNDDAKLASLVEAYRVGATVPAILALGDYALTGSHRYAAYQIARKAWEESEDGFDVEPTIVVVYLSDEDREAVEEEIEESVWDADNEDVLRAIGKVSSDVDVLATIAGQF